MKWRGLPCGPESVLAYLAGTKTQTRWAMSPQPPADAYIDARSHCGREVCFCSEANGPVETPWRCPYGIPGDGLYIKERFAFGKGWDDCAPRDVTEGEQVWYFADHTTRGGNQLASSFGRWRSSRFMPCWVARIFRELVEVRVERLQSISVGDCLTEGIFEIPGYPAGSSPDYGIPGIRSRISTAVGAYEVWWDSLHAKRGHGWDTNPCVWILTTKETEQRPQEIPDA